MTMENMLQKSNDYIKSLPLSYSDILYKYTNGSQLLNNSLARMGKFFYSEDFDFSVTSRFNFVKLQSLILNAPVSQLETNLYNLFAENLSLPIIDNKCAFHFLPIELHKGQNSILNIIFTSATTDQNVIQYMDRFVTVGPGTNFCCVQEIKVPSGIPMIYVEDISSYKWQKEAIMPALLSTIKQSSTPYSVNFKKHAMDYNVPDYFYDNTKKILNDGRQYYTLPTKELKYVELETFKNNMTVTSIFIDRNHIDNINEILSNYGLDSGRHHNAIHGCIVISTSIILLKFISDTPTKKEILETMYTSAYHDAGRHGADGIDIYERESANMALNGGYLDETGAENMSRRIVEEADDKLTDNIYYAYKSSDSLDYPGKYDRQYNPLNSYDPVRGNKCLDAFLSHSDTDISMSNEIKFIRLLTQCIAGPQIIESGKSREQQIKDHFDIYFEDYDEMTFSFDDPYQTKIIIKDYDADSYNDYNFIDIAHLPETVFEDQLNFLQLFNVRIRSIAKNNKYSIYEYIREFTEIIYSLKLICLDYIERDYLKDKTRVFDDYWEILTCVMPFMYLHFTNLPDLLVPYRPKDFILGDH